MSMFGNIRPEAFNGHLVHRIEYGPRRVPTVLVPEQATGMGYADPKDLTRLIQDLKRSGDLEEGEDCFTLDYGGVGDLRGAFAVGLKPTANPISPKTRELTMLTRSGVIVVCMRSELPLAQDFRKWAKRVLVEVLETGRYETGRYEEPSTDLVPAGDLVPSHAEIVLLRRLLVVTDELAATRLQMLSMQTTIHLFEAALNPDHGLRRAAVTQIPRDAEPDHDTDTQRVQRLRSRPSQDRVVALLRERGSAKRAEIAEVLGTSYWGARDLLTRMEAHGTIVGERILGQGNERHFRLVEQ